MSFRYVYRTADISALISALIAQRYTYIRSVRYTNGIVVTPLFTVARAPPVPDVITMKRSVRSKYKTLNP